MKFSIKDYFSKCDQIRGFIFLCSVHGVNYTYPEIRRKLMFLNSLLEFTWQLYFGM